MAEANIDKDDGNGHWFNLNSFLQEPEWVSKTYLGMVLQQSEAEGLRRLLMIVMNANSATLQDTLSSQSSKWTLMLLSHCLEQRLTRLRRPYLSPQELRAHSAPD
jgi:hypothetical protein